MANPQIKLKRSSTQNKRPSPANVPLGELALNTYDGYLYASKDVGAGTTIITVNPWRVGTGTDSYNINFTAGNVGIGSDSPTAKLDVNGDANISGVATITGGIDAIGIQSGGVNIATGIITALNFIGAGNTFALNGTVVDISIAGSSESTTRSVNRYVATADQTLFPSSGTVPYTVGYIDVFLNGTKLDSTEFTATNGTTITLVTGATADDVVELIAFNNVDLSGGTVINDTTPQLGGDLDINSNDITGTGNINLTGVVTASSFVKSGGTSSQFLKADGSIDSSTYLTDISQDTNPQLGGNLDLNSNDITGTGNLNITGIATFSGNVTIGGTLTYDDVTNIDSIGLVTARSGIEFGVSGVGGTITSTGNVTFAGIVTATSFSGELHTTSLLKEEVNITAGKLSDNTNIDTANGMVHFFTTTETTTSTPNIRYDASNTLNSKINIGETIAVSIITTCAAAGYSTAISIDGVNQTVRWNGGSLPSTGGSSGNDIYSFQTLKTADATYTVFGTLTNFAAG